MPIKDDVEPMKSCFCECSHEHLAVNDINPTRDDHLGPKHFQVALGVLHPCEGSYLWGKKMRWDRFLHDFSRERLRIVP